MGRAAVVMNACRGTVQEKHSATHRDWTAFVWSLFDLWSYGGGRCWTRPVVCLTIRVRPLFVCVCTAGMQLIVVHGMTFICSVFLAWGDTSVTLLWNLSKQRNVSEKLRQEAAGSAGCAVQPAPRKCIPTPFLQQLFFSGALAALCINLLLQWMKIV